MRIELTEDRYKARVIKNGGMAVYKVKIIYKSGASKEFWVKDFSCVNGTYTWEPLFITDKPVILGVDNIESVWQTDLEVLTDDDVEYFFKEEYFK